MNARPFNFQWFVPRGVVHEVFLTKDGGMFVGPTPPGGLRDCEAVAKLYGGNGERATGRIFQIAGNDVAAESPIVAPDNVTPMHTRHT